MGLQRTVVFASGTGPTWEQVLAGFEAQATKPVLRMIDGLPAFPDEVPPEDWRELRLYFPPGMVTLRRSPSNWQALVWGNSTPELLAARDQFCQIVADVGAGIISDP